MQRCQTISREDKLRLIRARRNGEDYLHVADVLRIKRSTARSILCRALKEDDPEELEERPSGVNNIKVDEEMRTTMSEILDRNPTITLQNLHL